MMLLRVMKIVLKRQQKQMKMKNGKLQMFIKHQVQMMMMMKMMIVVVIVVFDPVHPMIEILIHVNKKLNEKNVHLFQQKIN